VEARWAHNPKVAGSNPAPATKADKADSIESAFSFAPEKQSIIADLQKLPQADRLIIAQILQSKPANLLEKPIDGYDDWRSELRLRGLSEGTIELYSRTVRKLFEQYPAPSSRTIRAYLDDRLEFVTPTKVRNDQKALRSFFNFLEAEGLWFDNPVKGMQLLKTKKVIRQAPDKEHVDKLLRAWDGRERRLKFRLFILLFLDTGMRINEACTLRTENVNLERLEVKIMGKGGKERIVPISPVTADLIREYRQKNPNVKSDGYLFPYNGRNGYHSKHTLEKTFRRLCKRLGIPKITPHMLRHYFATYALRNGAKLEIVSRILGHSSVAITADVYRTVKQDEIQTEHRKYSPLASS
jgi:integrase/recombinase XerD